MRSRFCFLIDSSFQFDHGSCPAPLLCRTPKWSFDVLVNSGRTIIWSILIVTLFETDEASQVPLLPLLLSKMICSLYSFSKVEMSLMTGSSITKVPSNFRVSPQERKSLQYPRLLKLSTSAFGAFPPNIPLINMQHLELSYSPSDSHKSS